MQGQQSKTVPAISCPAPYLDGCPHGHHLIRVDTPAGVLVENALDDLMHLGVVTAAAAAGAAAAAAEECRHTV